MSHLGLKYVTIIGVACDDQFEAAARLYAEATRQIHAACPEIGVELLTDNSRGVHRAAGEVLSTESQVFGYNPGTVPRLMHRVYLIFGYHHILDIVSQACSRGLTVKSNLTLGLGEERHEAEATMHDMLNAGVDILIITQYLRPSLHYLSIERWAKPQELVELENLALEMGFAACTPGSLVRSGYRAGRLWVATMHHYERLIPPQFVHLEDGSDKSAW